MSLSKLELLFLSENSYVKHILQRTNTRMRNRHFIDQIYKDRINFGEFHHLYCQLRENNNLFYQYTRMTQNTFNYILEAIREKCTHKTTNFKKPISVEERLILTLR